MKTLFTLCVFFLLAFSLQAQLTVSTQPQNKNFLIERGTGMACCSCPGITVKCDNVIAGHPPGRWFLLEYHFGPDAKPQSGQLNVDYRTPYGDSILSWPFYLNMMVNRRDRGAPYGSTYIFGSTDQVTPECASVVSQPSPVNLAMTSTFDPLTRVITVTAKAYYTANSATTNNYLQIAITEDSLKSPQCDVSGWNYNFWHMNVFRANMNGFSGDLITQTTTGTTVTRTYQYTLPNKYPVGVTSGQTTCNPSHCKLTMYMTETPNVSGIQSFTGKIITVIRSRLGETVGSVTGMEEQAYVSNSSVYPNPSPGQFYLAPLSNDGYSYKVYDLFGREVGSGSGSGMEVKKVDAADLPKGMYTLRVATSAGTTVHKLLFVE